MQRPLYGVSDYPSSDQRAFRLEKENHLVKLHFEVFPEDHFLLSAVFVKTYREAEAVCTRMHMYTNVCNPRDKAERRLYLCMYMYLEYKCLWL